MKTQWLKKWRFRLFFRLSVGSFEWRYNKEFRVPRIGQKNINKVYITGHKDQHESFFFFFFLYHLNQIESLCSDFVGDNLTLLSVFEGGSFTLFPSLSPFSSWFIWTVLFRFPFFFKVFLFSVLSSRFYSSFFYSRFFLIFLYLSCC